MGDDYMNNKNPITVKDWQIEIDSLSENLRSSLNHSYTPTQPQHELNLLKKLAIFTRKNNPKYASYIYKSDCQALFLTSLYKYPTNTSNTLACLSGLIPIVKKSALDPIASQQLASSGAIERAVENLRQFPRDERIIIVCFKFLTKIASSKIGPNISRNLLELSIAEVLSTHINAISPKLASPSNTATLIAINACLLGCYLCRLLGAPFVQRFNSHDERSLRNVYLCYRSRKLSSVNPRYDDHLRGLTNSKALKFTALGFLLACVSLCPSIGKTIARNKAMIACIKSDLEKKDMKELAFIKEWAVGALSNLGIGSKDEENRRDQIAPLLGASSPKNHSKESQRGNTTPSYLPTSATVSLASPLINFLSSASANAPVAKPAPPPTPIFSPYEKEVKIAERVLRGCSSGGGQTKLQFRSRSRDQERNHVEDGDRLYLTKPQQAQQAPVKRFYGSTSASNNESRPSSAPHARCKPSIKIKTACRPVTSIINKESDSLADLAFERKLSNNDVGLLLDSGSLPAPTVTAFPIYPLSNRSYLHPTEIINNLDRGSNSNSNSADIVSDKPISIPKVVKKKLKQQRPNSACSTSTVRKAIVSTVSPTSRPKSASLLVHSNIFATSTNSDIGRANKHVNTITDAFGLGSNVKSSLAKSLLEKAALAARPPLTEKERVLERYRNECKSNPDKVLKDVFNSHAHVEPKKVKIVAPPTPISTRRPKSAPFVRVREPLPSPVVRKRVTPSPIAQKVKAVETKKKTVVDVEFSESLLGADAIDNIERLLKNIDRLTGVITKPLLEEESTDGPVPRSAESEVVLKVLPVAIFSEVSSVVIDNEIENLEEAVEVVDEVDKVDGNEGEYLKTTAILPQQREVVQPVLPRSSPAITTEEKGEEGEHKLSKADVMKAVTPPIQPTPLPSPTQSPLRVVNEVNGNEALKTTSILPQQREVGPVLLRSPPAITAEKKGEEGEHKSGKADAVKVVTLLIQHTTALKTTAILPQQQEVVPVLLRSVPAITTEEKDEEGEKHKPGKADDMQVPPPSIQQTPLPSPSKPPLEVVNRPSTRKQTFAPAASPNQKRPIRPSVKNSPSLKILPSTSPPPFSKTLLKRSITMRPTATG